MSVGFAIAMGTWVSVRCRRRLSLSLSLSLYRGEGTGIKMKGNQSQRAPQRHWTKKLTSTKNGRRRKKNPAPSVIVPVATRLDSSDTAPSKEIAGIDEGRSKYRHYLMMVYQVSPTMTMNTIRDKENLEVHTTDALMNCQKKKRCWWVIPMIFGWIVVV